MRIEASPGMATGLASGAVSFVVFALLSGSAVLLGGDFFAADIVQQPIAFNHQVHVEGQGMECALCHPGCATDIASGLPAASACALCHSEPQGESAEERRLVALLEAKTPLVWQSLFGQPAHVFFSHRRHTSVANIQCVTCHGSIGQSTAPPSTRNPLAMDQCIACHEERGASTDCSACHR